MWGIDSLEARPVEETSAQSFYSLEEPNQLSVQLILEMKARKETAFPSFLAGPLLSLGLLSPYCLIERHREIGIIIPIHKFEQVT